MGANDYFAEFFRGKTLAAGFCGTLFHGRLQSNAFNRADFRKAGPAKDEARLAAFSGRALLLLHVRNLPHIFSFAMPSRMGVVPDNWQRRTTGSGAAASAAGPPAFITFPNIPSTSALRLLRPLYRVVRRGARSAQVRCRRFSRCARRMARADRRGRD